MQKLRRQIPPVRFPVTARRHRPKRTGIAVAGAYFLAARLSLALLTKPDGVAVFWPAAGSRRDLDRLGAAAATCR